MKRYMLLLLMGCSASMSRGAETMFGLEPGITGIEGFEEMEKAEIPGMLDKADVPGKLFFRSPNGRYAFSRPTGEQAEKANYDVDNHLVDLKSMKALTRDIGGVGADFERKNHGGMHVKWRADSRVALFFGEAKWEPDTFSAIVIGDEGKVSEVNLEAPMRQVMVRELKRRWPEIHKKLKQQPSDAEELNLENDEISPWAQEYLRYGAAFTPDGKGVKVKATMVTNAKHMEEQIVANVVAEGVISLSDGTLKLDSVSVLDAGLVNYNDDGTEVMRPKVVFPKAVTKKKK